MSNCCLRSTSLAERPPTSEATFCDQLIATIPELTHYAGSLTRKRSDADDLVQDALERALTRQFLYAEIGSLLGWLKTVMRNLFLDQVRSQSRRARLDEAVFPEPQGRGVVKASQEDHRFLTELQEHLPRLRGDGGDIIIAVGVHGDSYDETATHLKLRRGTIASRLSRSRVALLQTSLMGASASRLEG